LWFGHERKQETLDEFSRTQLTSRQRKGIEAACVDMWEPFRLSIEEWAPECKITYDKFHVIGHANDAVDEVRKAEFFRQGREKRELIKGKKRLLLSRWKNLTGEQRGGLNELFLLNRRVFKAYLLKESLETLWDYQYRGAMLNYLEKWIDQLKWQRLAPFEKLADMLLKHLDGIANYCLTKVRFGVVEALNGNIRMLLVVATQILSKSPLRPRPVLRDHDLRPEIEPPMTRHEGKNGVERIRKALSHARSAREDDEARVSVKESTVIEKVLVVCE
jgi:transposase